MATHVQVAHAWAHQTGRARKGFNMFYEGTSIYSYGYHYCIAKLIDVRYKDNSEPQRVCLFNERTYSPSTGKHRYYVRAAVPHGYEVLEVKSPSAFNHLDNFEDCLKRAKYAADKAKAARSRAGWHLGECRDALHTASRLNDIFALGQTVPTLESLGVDYSDIQAKIDKANAQRAERDRLQRIERNKSNAERREAWLKGETVNFYGTDDKGRALLRVRGDNLETSQGVSVPLEEAINVFQIMRRCKDSAMRWEPAKPHSFRISDYPLDYIEQDGTLHAGCHVISLEEGERVWRQLINTGGVVYNHPEGWDKIEGGGHIA